MEAQISERAQHLLRVLIESHIRDGQPVGSKALACDSGIDVSPATIRNVMADLENLGLVTSPHTSAGRVPTAKGYRFFVDSLIAVKPLDSREIKDLKQSLGLDESIKGLAPTVSNMLSGITSMAGIVMLPHKTQQTIRHINFIPLSDDQVLVILVTNNKEIQNTIIRTERKFKGSELNKAANCLNAQLVGKDLEDVRRHLLKELQDTREHMDRIMIEAISMAEKVFQSDSADDDIVMAGHTKLMDYSELSDLEQLKKLFDAFSEKRELLHLLDKCMNAQGIQIFIGEESGFNVLDHCSVVTSTYQVDDQVLGVLGVIGPTRMDYQRVIPLVDVTAKLVSASLKQE